MYNIVFKMSRLWAYSVLYIFIKRKFRFLINDLKIYRDSLIVLKM